MMKRFLHLLATFDWTQRPLIVNFDDKLTPDDVSTIQKMFEQQKSSPRELRIPLWIAYPEDKTHNIWVSAYPPPSPVLSLSSLFLSQ